jgi:hypothetical protein
LLAAAGYGQDCIFFVAPPQLSSRLTTFVIIVRAVARWSD